ncbi:MAG TPA: hypothetical protein VNR86_08055 [Sphingomicrobium sp.]|nr:hypothetical protein [Sphingomicrobium sp.]
MYDTVSQYGQVLTNEVDDWHPPIMVRLWQLLHPFCAGSAPMFAIQVGLYALGIGLIVGALGRAGRTKAAFATFILGASPLLLGWQMVVLKDAQMLGALLAALGLAAHYRLQNVKIPFAAGAAMALLMAYATLVRTNAIFVAAPLAAFLLPRPKRVPARSLLAIVLILVVLEITPTINQRVLGAESSDIAKSEPIFDLAAIAVAAPAASSPFTIAERVRIERLHCVKAFFWDPLGDPGACAPVAQRLMTQPASALYLELARAVAAHPIAYLEHRLEHWNSTERWLVAPGLPDQTPPIKAEPNELGLGTPSSELASRWQDVAAVEAASPLGWPITWTAISLILLPAAWRRRAESAGGLALALLASGLVLEASFLAISIASDLRYHLWPMVAAPLALILLGDNLKLSRAERLAGTALVILVIAGGVISRASLPRAPDSYQGMIHAPTG